MKELMAALLQEARMNSEMIRNAYALATSERYDDLARSAYMFREVFRTNEQTQWVADDNNPMWN